uniref:BHLH domain-containing protein n=1 Tax=Ananas comosus var. bracteatus TaxID=296719 RepID=A0A6V7NPK8_ANACO|nr:unnamed protein product [Ananas comosus var. bracteatus]
MGARRRYHSASELTELNNGFLNLSTWDQSNFDSALSSLVSSPPLPLPPPPRPRQLRHPRAHRPPRHHLQRLRRRLPPSPAPAAAAAAAAAPLPATAPRSAPPEAPPPPPPSPPPPPPASAPPAPQPPRNNSAAPTPRQALPRLQQPLAPRRRPDDEDESSSSIPDGAPKPGNARKRKGAQRQTVITPIYRFSDRRARFEREEKQTGRCDRAEAQNEDDAGEKKGKESNARPPEPPKDYIHVRARRGQATDSHSLAERVRREKISERMKFLQDLVPGCNKVFRCDGKAVMLDEIINYVQSLQRQVEFLSMKLATMNPRLEFNMDNLLPKDGHHHPLQSVVNNGVEMPLSSSLHRSLSMPLPPLDGFADASSQLGTFWEDDLQSVVQMGFGQTQEAATFSSQSFHGTMSTSRMKIEL